MKIQKTGLFMLQPAQSIQSVATHKTSMLLATDTVSFGARFPMSLEKTKELAHTLTNSTSGVRKIGQEYEEIVEPLILGAMSWMKEQGIRNVTVAYDSGRTLTKDAAQKVATMLVDNGFHVFTKTNGKITNANKIAGLLPTSTPEAALATREIHNTVSGKAFGILLTPSHNPWEYGGFNFLTHHAEVASEKITNKIGNHMIKIAKSNKDVSVFTKISDKIGKIHPIDTFAMYNKNINEKVGINWKKIQDAGIDIIYDDLGGTGGSITPRLFRDNGVQLKAILSTRGKDGPNPVAKNMHAIVDELAASKNKLALGLCNDGDVDRVGEIVVKNQNGALEFLTFNDVGVLLTHHLFKNRGLSGKEGNAVIINHATSPLIAAVAEKHGAKVIETPVGFKYIGEEIQHITKEGKNAVLAMEESGGGTILGNIPEKDGPVILAALAELAATEKKPLTTVLKEIKDSLYAAYKSGLTNFKFTQDAGKSKTVNALNDLLNGAKAEFAGLEVDLAKTQAHHRYILSKRTSGDGTKIFFKDGTNVLLRNSGTEPKTKIYINAAGQTPEESAVKYDKLAGLLDAIAEKNGGVKA